MVMNLYSHSVLSLQTTLTQIETTEQFILLHTRYVCDFSGLTNFSQNSETRRKHLYRTSFTSSVFLALTHDEFFATFQGKKFRLENVCLYQRLGIGQFIRKSFFLVRVFACWLLDLRGVLNFFLCFWSELATDEVVLHGTIRLDSKISLSECSLS